MSTMACIILQPLACEPCLAIGIGYSVIDGEFQTDAINVDVNHQSFPGRPWLASTLPIRIASICLLSTDF